jgi:hypothetical protein
MDSEGDMTADTLNSGNKRSTGIISTKKSLFSPSSHSTADTLNSGTNNKSLLLLDSSSHSTADTLNSGTNNKNLNLQSSSDITNIPKKTTKIILDNKSLLPSASTSHSTSTADTLNSGTKEKNSNLKSDASPQFTSIGNGSISNTTTSNIPTADNGKENGQSLDPQVPRSSTNPLSNNLDQSISTNDSLNSSESNTGRELNSSDDRSEETAESISQRKNLKRKRDKYLSMDTYNNMIQFLQDPKSIESISERRKLSRLSKRYKLKNDQTNQEWPKGLVLLKSSKDKFNNYVWKIYVPTTKKHIAIHYFHQNGPNKHQGWVRTYKLVSNNYTGVTETDVRDYVNNCDACIKYNPICKKPRLKPILSTHVMNRIQIDLKEYTLYSTENEGYNYQLTVVDHFSGFPWAFPQFTKSSHETAYNLMKLFFVFGPCEILHSDNGGEFVNKIVDELSVVFGFRCAHGKAYNPQEQGKVEKLNGTIATMLAKLMYERKSNRWIDLLEEVLYSYRITYNLATRKTPFEVFYMRQPNRAYNLPGDDKIQQAEDYQNEEEIGEISDRICQEVREQQERNAQIMLRYIDTKNTQNISVGDFVMVDLHNSKKIQQKRPLGKPLFAYPGTVVDVHKNKTIIVKWKNGETSEVIENNKYKVVSEQIYETTDCPNDDEDMIVENSIQEIQTTTTQMEPLNPGGLEQEIDRDNADENWVPLVGQRVEIYWENEKTWYPGEVVKHLEKSGKFRVIYDDDGDNKMEIFERKFWRRCKSKKLLQTQLKFNNISKNTRK